MTLAGVVSWGFGCADADALGIYAEVSHFTSWLNEQMPDLNSCPPYLDGATPSPSPVTTAPTPSPSPSTTASSPSPVTTSQTNTTVSCGNCVFPFIYGGRIHDRCTTIDGDSKPWCSTDATFSGGWEYCEDSSCPGLSASTTEQMSVNPINEVGSCCKQCTYNFFF